MPYKPVEAPPPTENPLRKALRIYTQPVAKTLGVEKAVEELGHPGLNDSKLEAQLKGFASGAGGAVTPAHLVEAVTLLASLPAQAGGLITKLPRLFNAVGTAGNVASTVGNADQTIKDINDPSASKLRVAGDVLNTGLGALGSTTSGLAFNTARKAANAAAPAKVTATQLKDMSEDFIKNNNLAGLHPTQVADLIKDQNPVLHAAIKKNPGSLEYSVPIFGEKAKDAFKPMSAIDQANLSQKQAAVDVKAEEELAKGEKAVKDAKIKALDTEAQRVQKVEATTKKNTLAQQKAQGAEAVRQGKNDKARQAYLDKVISEANAEAQQSAIDEAKAGLVEQPGVVTETSKGQGPVGEAQALRKTWKAPDAEGGESGGGGGKSRPIFKIFSKADGPDAARIYADSVGGRENVDIKLLPNGKTLVHTKGFGEDFGKPFTKEELSNAIDASEAKAPEGEATPTPEATPEPESTTPVEDLTKSPQGRDLAGPVSPESVQAAKDAAQQEAEAAIAPVAKANDNAVATKARSGFKAVRGGKPKTTEDFNKAVEENLSKTGAPETGQPPETPPEAPEPPPAAPTPKPKGKGRKAPSFTGGDSQYAGKVSKSRGMRAWAKKQEELKASTEPTASPAEEAKPDLMDQFLETQGPKDVIEQPAYKDIPASTQVLDPTTGSHVALPSEAPKAGAAPIISYPENMSPLIKAGEEYGLAKAAKKAGLTSEENRAAAATKAAAENTPAARAALTPEDLAVPPLPVRRGIIAAMKKDEGQSGAIDPILALRLGSGVAGGLVGSQVDEDHPYIGGALGAAAGLGAPSLVTNPAVEQAATNLPEAVNTGLRNLNKLRNSMLLSPASVAKKGAGDIQALITAAATHPTKAGDILKQLFTPEGLSNIGTNFKEGTISPEVANASGLENFVTNAGNPMSWAGRLMGGLTKATKGVLGEAGFSPDEYNQLTMTAEPTSVIGKKLYEASRESPLIQNLFPFMRMAINRIERGVDYSPLAAFKRSSWAPGNKADAAAKALAGTGASIGSYYAVPDNFVKEHPFATSIAAAGPMGLPILFGMAAGSRKSDKEGYEGMAQEGGRAVQAASRDIPGMEFAQSLTRDPWFSIPRNYLGGYTNALKSTAELTDPNQTPVDDKSQNLDTRGKLLNRMLGNIPITRATLPHQDDAEGLTLEEALSQAPDAVQTNLAKMLSNLNLSGENQ